MQVLYSTFLDKVRPRVGIVSYKDHGDTEGEHVECFDFTINPDKVFRFVKKLSASGGGGDAPEDALGGLNAALNMEWERQTRCIIHITDAPCHGRALYDYRHDYDRYPDAGSELHGLTPTMVIQRMLDLNINYTPVPLSYDTDRMALVFFEAFSALTPSCRLATMNKYSPKNLECIRAVNIYPALHQVIANINPMRSSETHDKQANLTSHNSMTPTATYATSVFMLLESWFEGPYVKYNSNGGWLNEELESMNVYQAAQSAACSPIRPSRPPTTITYASPAPT
ncbi:hypothetical protein Sste5344_006365 [Sporothrix stenoceras]